MVVSSNHSGEDELTDILEEVLSIKSSYFPLGKALRLPVNKLKAIREEYSSDEEEALSEVLLLWLGKGYNVEKFGEPTWQLLVEAVDKKSGGNDSKLAQIIATNHPAGE